MTKLANHSVAVSVKGLLYIAPDCLSSCLNWVPQPPSPVSEYGSPLGPKWGEPHSLAGDRGDPIQTTGH